MRAYHAQCVSAMAMMTLTNPTPKMAINNSKIIAVGRLKNITTTQAISVIMTNKAHLPYIDRDFGLWSLFDWNVFDCCIAYLFRFCAYYLALNPHIYP